MSKFSTVSSAMAAVAAGVFSSAVAAGDVSIGQLSCDTSGSGSNSSVRVGSVDGLNLCSNKDSVGTVKPSSITIRPVKTTTCPAIVHQGLSHQFIFSQPDMRDVQELIGAKPFDGLCGPGTAAAIGHELEKGNEKITVNPNYVTGDWTMSVDVSGPNQNLLSTDMILNAHGVGGGQTVTGISYRSEPTSVLK